MDRTIACHLLSISLATLLSPISASLADSAPTDSAPAPNVETIAAAAAPAKCSCEPIRLFRYDSYPEAWTAAQDSNKPILVYITMPNCPHCTKMVTRTFADPAVNDMLKNSFETIQAHRYVHTVLIEKLHVKWYPTTVLVGPNNKVLDMIEGYVDANSFKNRLQLGVARCHEGTQTR